MQFIQYCAESEKQNGYECSGCFFHDHVAEWELRLTATAQHPKGGLDHVLLAMKRSNFRSPGTASTEAVSLFTVLMLNHC